MSWQLSTQSLLGPRQQQQKKANKKKCGHDCSLGCHEMAAQSIVQKQHGSPHESDTSVEGVIMKNCIFPVLFHTRHLTAKLNVIEMFSLSALVCQSRL